MLRLQVNILFTCPQSVKHVVEGSHVSQHPADKKFPGSPNSCCEPIVASRNWWWLIPEERHILHQYILSGLNVWVSVWSIAVGVHLCLLGRHHIRNQRGSHRRLIKTNWQCCHTRRSRWNNWSLEVSQRPCPDSRDFISSHCLCGSYMFISGAVWHVGKIWWFVFLLK